MLVLFTLKESIFTLEVHQSQYQINSYFAVIIYEGKVHWSQRFNSLEVATQQGTSMLKNITLTNKCNTLATKYFEESMYCESMNEPVEAKLYLKKHFFYDRRFTVRCDMGFWVEGGY